MVFLCTLFSLLFARPTGGLTCVCSTCFYSNCTVSAGGKCFVSVRRDSELGISLSSGCLGAASAPLQCLSTLPIRCCSDHDLCNAEVATDMSPISNGPSQENKEKSTGSEREENGLGVIALAAAGAGVVFVLTLSLLIVCVKRYSHCHGRPCLKAGNRRNTPVFHRNAPVFRSLFGVHRMEESVSSGSGSGPPHLSPRTISQHLHLIHTIGQGRFADVWKAEWQKQAVAVKIFHAREEESWLRETELYQLPMLRHDNILGFIAADLYSTGSETQLWLITDYHANGSVYDFLQVNTISLHKLHCMAQSTVSGLVHLHTEIVGVQGKPAIAHRDLKSRNVLIKRDGSCAIGDLGLAVKQQSDLHVGAQLLKSGTRRYMAPEVLDESINSKDFDSFRRADIYSLGLVLWELGRRSYTDGIAAHEYETPYKSAVSGNPSTEDMRCIVCVQGRRPPLAEEWDRHSELRVYSKLVRECWNGNSLARLTAARVKKTLLQLCDGSPS